MSKNIDKSFMRDVAGDIQKIDASDPNNLSNKVLNERETRSRLLTHARMLGCEKDMMLLFVKYDKLLKNCNNPKERLDMAKLGVFEMYSLLGRGGELFVNGELVYSEKDKSKIVV